jgi:BlaI family transcriptional regulator, penicillinase repressor
MSDADNNSFTIKADRRPARRRSVLDLAPLELECMNTLWPLGEGTVRDIRDRLAPRRPRAYTTIMTIMDRLAKKGVVERQKVGRAYIYRPHLTAEEARSQAVGQLIDSFFAGSKEALLAELRVPAPLAASQALAAVAGANPGAAIAGATPGGPVASATAGAPVGAGAMPGAPVAGLEIGPAAAKVARPDAAKPGVVKPLGVSVAASAAAPSGGSRPSVSAASDEETSDVADETFD